MNALPTTNRSFLYAEGNLTHAFRALGSDVVGNFRREQISKYPMAASLAIRLNSRALQRSTHITTSSTRRKDVTREQGGIGI